MGFSATKEADSLNMQQSDPTQAKELSYQSSGMPDLSEHDIQDILGSRDARDKFVNKFLPYIRARAEKFSKKLPTEAHCEFDDLVNEGVIALLDICQSFDPNLGNKFLSYAQMRINGAMLDHLRDLDFVPRLVRKNLSSINKAVIHLTATLFRKPNLEDIAAHLGKPVEEISSAQNELTSMTSIDAERNHDSPSAGRTYSKNLSLAADLVDRKAQDADKKMDLEDLMLLIERGLSKEEKRIFNLYYYHGRTMKEIGDRMDLSESRVSQMHSTLILRIQQRLCEMAKSKDPKFNYIADLIPAKKPFVSKAEKTESDLIDIAQKIMNAEDLDPLELIATEAEPSFDEVNYKTERTDPPVQQEFHEIPKRSGFIFNEKD